LYFIGNRGNTNQEEYAVEGRNKEIKLISLNWQGHLQFWISVKI